MREIKPNFGWTSTAWGQRMFHFFKDRRTHTKPICGSQAMFTTASLGFFPRGARTCKRCMTKLYQKAGVLL